MQGDAGLEEGGGEPPPIVVKKVVAGGHHGGAWKVAYADFVTAMMALFIVLWLMSASKEQQEAVSGYFNDPKGFEGKFGGQGEGGGQARIQGDKASLEGLAENLSEAMKETRDFELLQEQIQLNVTGDGLRIELMETASGTFFQSGSEAPTGSGREILATIAEELAQLPNKIIIEGHTDAAPFRGRSNYSNWELSVDRANAARRLLREVAIPEDQIVEVRGFADVMLRTPDDPTHPSNRRISLIVKHDKGASNSGADPRAPVAVHPSPSLSSGGTQEEGVDNLTIEKSP